MLIELALSTNLVTPYEDKTAIAVHQTHCANADKGFTTDC